MNGVYASKPSAVGLAFVLLLVLATPTIGTSQTPHPCLSNGTTHMGTSLPGVTSYPFYYDKSCSTESGALVWTIKVYTKNNLTGAFTQLPSPCSFGPTAVPTGAGPYGPVTCTGLTRGTGNPQVIIVIDFERAIGGPMSHSHNFTNP